ncbi:MAG: hypothetical protein AAF318_01315 [Pseudomonadota bacterium]
MAIDLTPGAPRWYELARADNGSILQSPDLVAEADRIAPRLDGETVLLGNRPADFDLDNPPTFRQFHTAHQLEFIALRQPDDNLTAILDEGGTAISTRTLSLPPGADPADQLHAIVSADGRGVIIVNDLTPSALNRLSFEDQALVAAHPEFARLIAEPFGLRPATGDGRSADVRAEIIADVDTAIAAMEAEGPLRPSSGVDDPAELIIAQLEALKARLGAMAIFDKAAIDATIADALTRFQRLSLYGAVPENPTDSLISTDGNASVRAAYDIFVQSEQRRLDILRVTDGIAQTGLLAVEGTDGSIINRTLDAPLLVFAFERAENADGEAEGQAETEEIRQRNVLLADYASMQEIINKVSASFPPPDGDLTSVNDTRRVTDALSGDELLEALATLSMFDVALAGTHPAEALASLDRPTLALQVNGTRVDGAFTKDAYDNFSTILGDAVGVLDRDVQILADKANEISRQRNRHFDLATQTMTRMTDLIVTISGAIN